MNDWLRSLEVVPTIAMLREAVEDIRRSELERLGNRLSDLTDEQRAQVEMLTASIVNKILHVPTVQDEGGRRAATSATCTSTPCARCSTSRPGRTARRRRARRSRGRRRGRAGHAAAGSRGRAAGGRGAAGGTVHQLRGTGTEDA